MDREKLCITVYGSAAYDYAAVTLIDRIAAQRGLCDYDVLFIWIGCNTLSHKENIEDLTRNRLPAGIEVAYINVGPAPDLSKVKAYKTEAQMYIARMQNEGFACARKWGADYCWSVEADVLPPSNALACMMDMIRFDDGYYDAAMVTYPDQSGGSFLGGNGTAQNQIAEDYTWRERDLPDNMKERIEKREAEAGQGNMKSSVLFHKWKARAKKYPPKGNIFELNSKGWRARGWLQNAYPGVGRGAVVPTDWTGMGCTLMSKKALAVTNFTGYQGQGTQDLFVNWNCWAPEGVRACVITHIACSHVIRERNEDQTQNFKKLTLVQPYHEQEGEFRRHLRIKKTPWPSESMH